MRYVVIGTMRAINAFQRERRLALHEVIPVPAAGQVWQVLHGLNPEEVTIVLVHGSDHYLDAQSRDHIERLRALGAQFLVAG